MPQGGLTTWIYSDRVRNGEWRDVMGYVPLTKHHSTSQWGRYNVPIYIYIYIYMYIYVYIYMYIYICIYTYIHNLFRHYLDREIMMKPMDLGVPYIFAYNSRSISRKCALSWYVHTCSEVLTYYPQASTNPQTQTGPNM